MIFRALFFRRLRILPLLVIVAGLALVVRVGEFAGGMERAGIAFAQQESHEQPPPLPESHDAASEKRDVKNKESDDKEDGRDSVPVLSDPAAAEHATEGEAIIPDEKKEWKDASESGFEYSDVKEGLYKDLAQRRADLEKREQTLATREALLEAAGRELDQKIREMTAVRNEIEGLLKAQSDQEQAQVISLVKIYEGMKAKDAARIFNTLDMDVLMAVLSRMSERKSAPILAEMTAERARAVTILMAQQKQFPTIPPQ